METVIFEVFGDLALFRKFYTNTSILTYPFPPPTATLGIIGAIVGIEKEKLFDTLSNVEVAISIVEPIRKIRFSLNYINTKDRTFTLKRGRTQIPTEFIKSPHYRIYVRNLDRELNSKFVYLLQNHKSIFIPYLGISELFCNFSFVGKEESEDLIAKEEVEVSSVVPLDEVTVFPKKEGQKLLKERVPHAMNSERLVIKYSDVVLDEEANKILIKGSYSRVGEENVVFFKPIRAFLTSW
ncbi:MAG: type I-B CRISPR-associated protein Cas5b [Caldisericum sp.]